MKTSVVFLVFLIQFSPGVATLGGSHIQIEGGSANQSLEALQKVADYTDTLSVLCDPSSTHDAKFQALKDSIPSNLPAADMNIALQVATNISAVQQYIADTVKTASPNVQQAYADITQLTGDPSFYNLPKKDRIVKVSDIVDGLSATDKAQLLELDESTRAKCKANGVDQQPYTLGNIFGNKLSNGAIIPK